MLERTKMTADRVTPILHAMEQSISAARQRRVQNTGAMATPTGAGQKTSLDGEVASQLKARPKRSTTFLNGS